MNSKMLFLLISNIKGVGNKTINMIMDLYEKCDSTSELIVRIKYLNLKVDLKSVITTTLINRDEILKYYLLHMKEHEIEVIDIESQKHSYSLRHIDNAPRFLYSIGKLGNLNKNIAVIGARNCSEYGRRTAYEIGYELAKYDFAVTSGMAYGIDAAAHKGALDGGGKTIAVLGSGVDVCYPKSNYNLYNRIKKNGLILSEFALGEHPSKYTFPLRNRIISGLCFGVIVVEAKESSGTMITVKYALDQGRQIFAVPGNINSDLSVGTNLLIKNGAIPYTNIDDLINDIIGNNH